MRVDFNGHFKVGGDFAEEEDVGEGQVCTVAIHGLHQGRVVNLGADPGHAEDGEAPRVTDVVDVILREINKMKTWPWKKIQRTDFFTNWDFNFATYFSTKALLAVD